STEVKAVLATATTIGLPAGPRTPGTALMLGHMLLHEINGVQQTFGYARGGMGGISHAFAKAASHSGATIPTSAQVCRTVMWMRRRLCVHRVPEEGLGRREMGRALAGTVPGRRPPFGNGSQCGASGELHAVGVLAILAVPGADRVLGRSEGRSWRHNPRDPRRVRSESPT